MNLLNTLKLPYYFLKNLQYDRLTNRVMEKIITPVSNCIDIGCHKGKILDRILALAPGGSHWAFEPLPDLYQHLVKKYKDRNVTISAAALSDRDGETFFTSVKNSPGYSGFRKRVYHIPFPQIEEIRVQRQQLDQVIPPSCKIDFIKLDVEGAELEVLKGAAATIQKNKPYIIFEHGQGAAPFYQTRPEDVYGLLTQYGLSVSTLKAWLEKNPPLEQDQFSRQFNQELNYYFIAHPSAI